MTDDDKKLVRLFIRYAKERGIYAPYFKNRANDTFGGKNFPQ